MNNPHKKRHSAGISLNDFKKLFATALCWIGGLSMTVAENVEKATGLRSSGKIYVVVACVVLIFIGIVVYLIRLERQLKRLEQSQKEESEES